jgi:hypothetical protein
MFMLVLLVCVSSVTLAVLVFIYVTRDFFRRRFIRERLISADVAGHLLNEPMLPPFDSVESAEADLAARRRAFYSRESEAWAILARVFVDDYVDDRHIRSIIDRHARFVASFKAEAPKSEPNPELRIIRFLISRGVEDQDLNLFKAVFEKDIDGVRKALELGADPDARLNVVLERYEAILKDMPR